MEIREGGKLRMAAEQHPDQPPGLAVRSDRPLIGIVLIEDGHEVTHYFADEADADAAVAAQDASGARCLAGAWSDLEWDDVASALDRIRHESTPTPPIDDL